EAIERVAKVRKKREEDELLCRGYILNTLSDQLYDLFSQKKSVREIWNAQEFKYKVEEEGTNKYLTVKYLDFKMVDRRPVLKQVHEIHGEKIFQNRSKLVQLSLNCHHLGKIKERNFCTNLRKSLWSKYRKKKLRIEGVSRLRDDKNSLLNESKVSFVKDNTPKLKNVNLQTNKSVQFKKKNSQKNKKRRLLCLWETWILCKTV
ncbi:hypothetical protein CFOL_v3_13987, partial [Cephalotus follicularis]